MENQNINITTKSSTISDDQLNELRYLSEKYKDKLEQIEDKLYEEFGENYIFQPIGLEGLILKRKLELLKNMEKNKKILN